MLGFRMSGMDPINVSGVFDPLVCSRVAQANASHVIAGLPSIAIKDMFAIIDGGTLQH